MWFTKLIGLLLFLGIFVPFSNGIAQSDLTGNRPVTQTYLIRSATVIPRPGVIQSGQDVLFKDGIIKSVGRNLTAPPEAVIIPGDSLYVYPGFIDVANKLDVASPPEMEKPDDFDSSNPDDYLAGIHPQVNVLDHLNTQRGEWRRLGFTLVQKVPMGMGLLPGKTAVIGYSHPHEQVVLAEDVAVYARFNTVGGMYPANNLGVMAKFRDLFQNAKLLDIHLAQYNSTTGVRIPEKNPVLESLVPVVNQMQPVYFEIEDQLDIGRALRLQEEIGFKLILGGISEGEQYIPTIKARQVAVSLSLNLPAAPTDSVGPDLEEIERKRFERVSAAYTNRVSLPAKYAEAGIPFAFTTKHLAKDKFFDNLHLLIDHGLSEDAALAALTINPANILGISRVAGDIQVGKQANFVISTDPLFDKEAQIKFVIVNGHVYEYEINKGSVKAASNGVEHWNYQASTPAGESSGELVIWRESGKWVGEITIDDPVKPGQLTLPLEDIDKSATMLGFGFSLDSNDRKIKLNVQGEISGTTFHGTLDVMGTEQFPFKAVKKNMPTS
ncbi:amidohydrolase family protein [Lunatimonas salinarum]|uniref:amidohydrolase family protein n=1 Tax=Lunatimonas salinarum TaxID=1774590 RepID=UPI001ADEFBCB|nr:amidohydrolase family protein [Lunatimonas salinarum]